MREEMFLSGKTNSVLSVINTTHAPRYDSMLFDIAIRCLSLLGPFTERVVNVLIVHGGMYS